MYNELFLVENGSVNIYYNFTAWTTAVETCIKNQKYPLSPITARDYNPIDNSQPQFWIGVISREVVSTRDAGPTGDNMF